MKIPKVSALRKWKTMMNDLIVFLGLAILCMMALATAVLSFVIIASSIREYRRGKYEQISKHTDNG